MTYPALNNFQEVRVVFGSDNYAIDIAENGYINKPSVLGNFALWVKPFPGEIIIQVKADKTTITREDEAERSEVRHGYYVEELAGWCQLMFSTEFSKSGILCTKFPHENDFRLLRLVGGEMEMCQISIVSQQGEFYLFFTPQYRGKVFSDEDGRIHIKNCYNLDPSNWPQLQPALHFLTDGMVLEDFKGHDAEEVNVFEQALNKVASREVSDFLQVADYHGIITGRTIWYNPALHFGVLEIYLSSEMTGDYALTARVHESQLVDSSQHPKPKILCPGDVVTVGELNDNPVDTRRFGTNFRFDAKKATIIERGIDYLSQFASF